MGPDALRCGSNRPARKAELIDSLHSVVQKAVVKREGKTAVIEGVLTPDYPIIVRLR